MHAMNRRLEQLLDFYRKDASDPFVTYGIAMEYFKAGDVGQGLHWLDATIALDADYAYAYYQKARALAEDGRAEEARAAIEQGLAAASRKGDSHAASELATLRESI